MAIFASIGVGTDLDSGQAGISACRQAQTHLQRLTNGIGFVFVSNEYDFEQVMKAVKGILTDLPLVGLSVSGVLSKNEYGSRGVAVALLSGDGLNARTGLWPQSGTIPTIPAEFVHPGRRRPSRKAHNQAMLIVADGLNPDLSGMLSGVPPGAHKLFGALSGGSLDGGRTYQYGDDQSGSGGLAAAWMEGPFSIGIAEASAWHPVGVYGLVTRAEGVWIRELDGERASQFYARWLGRPDRAWAFPPLNHLARLYPLGLEEHSGQGPEERIIRSPLRFEADGSLRMHVPISQPNVAHLLVGSLESCRAAAKSAAQKALEELGDATPLLALLLVDVGWKMQLEHESGADLEAVRAVIGKNVPIIGGYTFGQFHGDAQGEAHLLNQHIQVILFADNH